MCNKQCIMDATFGYSVKDNGFLRLQGGIDWLLHSHRNGATTL